MALIYKHAYAEHSVYSNAVGLLKRTVPGQGAHIDVGCGYGAIAEPVEQELGLRYFGFDIADDGLLDLRARGFAVKKIDLADPHRAEEIIRDTVGTTPIVSLSILDTLEHLTNGQAVLKMLRRLADASATLIISVPNVSHKDIVLKGLVGKWDITEAGLLDHTHVDFYNSERLRDRTLATGWEQIERNDWLLEVSDQHFPNDLPLFDITSPVGGYLREMIEQANSELLVNQFVRAFRPVDVRDVSLFAARSKTLEAGLSVIVLANQNEDKAAALQSLAIQSNKNFEVVFVCTSLLDAACAESHLAEVFKSVETPIAIVALPVCSRSEMLTAAAARASRSHLAFVFDDTKLADGWAAAMLSAIEAEPKKVVRVHSEPLEGERLSPFLESDQEVAEFATPRAVLSELGFGFNDGGDVAETQIFITRAILTCGLSNVPAPHWLIPPRQRTANRNDPVPSTVLRYLNMRPLILPPGAALELERRFQQSRVGHAERRFLNELPQVAEFARPYLAALGKGTATDSDNSRRPFLSILSRTQGSRLDPLREMLLSLGGQSDEDFEVVLVVHSADDAVVSVVVQMVEEFPVTFRSRVRVHKCEIPGRSSPLNVGVKVARGNYFAVLDDDDFVFGHYVETFRKLASQASGRILRAVCARQKFAHISNNETINSRAQSWFEMTWPDKYDAVAHLHLNYTPFMSVAYPRIVFDGLGMLFEESLSTLEDWQLTTKAASLCGIVSTSEVTSVYRWWTDGISSLFIHSSDEWAANRLRVIEEGSSSPILLPAGAQKQISGIIDLANSRAHASEPEAFLDDSVAIESARAHLTSTSWRLTRPLRVASARLRGSPSSGLTVKDVPKTADEARKLVEQIRASFSWKVTLPIRRLGRILRRQYLH